MKVVTHGHRLSYLTAGEGEPLVLMPGLMQAAVDWVDAGYPTLLGDRFRLIIIDPLGFGESDKPHASADYTFTARADHVEAVLDAERIDAAHVWGYSFGTMITEAFARLRPDRTRSIVLGGSLPGLKGADRRNLSESDLDVYRSGDWDRVWTEILPFVPAERRRLFSDGTTSWPVPHRRKAASSRWRSKATRCLFRCSATSGPASGGGKQHAT